MSDAGSVHALLLRPWAPADAADLLEAVAGSTELGRRVNNPASCRVASMAGFGVEGLERQKLKYGDERFDVELHAQLATDPIPDVAGVVLRWS